MQDHWDAAHTSPLEGANAATSASTADQRNKTPGQELSADEEKSHGLLVAAAKVHGSAAWKISKVFEPVSAGTPPNAIVDTRWALTCKMEEGKGA